MGQGPLIMNVQRKRKRTESGSVVQRTPKYASVKRIGKEVKEVKKKKKVVERAS